MKTRPILILILFSILLCCTLPASLLGMGERPANKIKTFKEIKEERSSDLPAGSEQEKERYQGLDLFNRVLYLVENNYYRPISIEKLIQGAIRGMMATLDPHSDFLDKDFLQRMTEETKGEFGGLGIELTLKDGVLTVITPIDSSPAMRAGILPGDKIVSINDKSTIGLGLSEAMSLLAETKEKGSANLGILRRGEEGIKYFALQKEIIKIEGVKGEIIGEEFVYVKVSQFQEDVAEDLSKLLEKFKKGAGKKKLKGVVLDLRNNPGGLLNEAIELASIFLKEGIVVSTEQRDPKQKETKYVIQSGVKELNLPLAVLINGASASASEIVAGALQDHRRALILGQISFGKGSVQQIIKVSENQGIKLTIAQYMTPLGRKIQAQGIKPDIILEDIPLEAYSATHAEEASFIREVDLRNHLTATIESASEKIAREKREAAMREKRRQQLEQWKEKQQLKTVKGGPKDKGTGLRKLKSLGLAAPSEDYQVNQAINYLRSLKVLKELNLSSKNG